MANPNDDNRRTIQAVDRACTILDAVRQFDDPSLTELSEKVDLSLGSLQTHMNTLEKNGFILKEERRYRLAPKFLTYGEHVRNNLTLYRAGRKVVDDIAYETDQNAHLITYQSGKEVTLYQSFGEKSVGSDLYVWHQGKVVWQLHWSASGKAILAHLPEEQVREIINERGLKRRTPHTITDEESLFAELEKIRERGYALNDEEELEGMRAVAAPIQDQDTIYGSISLSGPKSQIPDKRFYNDLPEYIINKANIIKVRLQTEEFQRSEDVY